VPAKSLQLEVPVLLQHDVVRGQPAAAAQVADQIPVQRADVLAARLRIRPAQREVDGAADLLVGEELEPCSAVRKRLSDARLRRPVNHHDD
jgi:hypothetical protein